MRSSCSSRRFLPSKSILHPHEVSLRGGITSCFSLYILTHYRACPFALVYSLRGFRPNFYGDFFCRLFFVVSGPAYGMSSAQFRLVRGCQYGFCGGQYGSVHYRGVMTLVSGLVLGFFIVSGVSSRRFVFVSKGSIILRILVYDVSYAQVRVYSGEVLYSRLRHGRSGGSTSTSRVGGLYYLYYVFSSLASAGLYYLVRSYAGYYA